MPEHRQAFQRELDAIDAKVIELFDLVAADLARATPALPNGNSEVVKVLAEHGLVIDLLGPEIEKLVKTAILLQAPVASDLRFLLCVLRILPELEHSHYLVVALRERRGRAGQVCREQVEQLDDHGIDGIQLTLKCLPLLGHAQNPTPCLRALSVAVPARSPLLPAPTCAKLQCPRTRRGPFGTMIFDRGRT